jgi:hypothetical protein
VGKLLWLKSSYLNVTFVVGSSYYLSVIKQWMEIFGNNLLFTESLL